jgi:hypothetical protein
MGTISPQTAWNITLPKVLFKVEISGRIETRKLTRSGGGKVLDAIIHGVLVIAVSKIKLLAPRRGAIQPKGE